MKRIHAERVVAVIAAGMLPAWAGCTSPGFPDAAVQTIDRAGAAEGNLRRVRSIPTMRLDARLAADLADAMDEESVEPARRRALDAVEAARRLGVATLEREVRRLSNAQLADLWRRHLGPEYPPADIHAAVYARLLEACRPLEDEWVMRIQSAASIADLRATVAALSERIAPLAVDEGRASRTVVYALAGRHEPTVEDLARADDSFRYAGTPVWYEPDLGSARGILEVYPEAYSEAELLLKLAPTILQEQLRLPSYAAASDRIGEVVLGGDGRSPAVSVDVSRPAVYAYWQRAVIRGDWYLQLVYCWWYPAYPELALRSAFAGPLDGFTLRITLDRDHRPAIFETIRNSGDEHNVWVSVVVEAAVKREFTNVEFGAAFAVERPSHGGTWRISGLVDAPARPDTGPIVRVRPGTHRPFEITYDRDVLVMPERELTPERYRLEPYERLEGGAGQVARLFDARGLVVGAERPNGSRRAWTGSLAPGQPRQRGTYRIDGGDDFDDPELLQRRLRFPPGF